MKLNRDERKTFIQSSFLFGSRFSTDICLIHLDDFIKFQMDKCNVVDMILLDLQKAFDTVDYSIVLTKLDPLVLAMTWFQLCLSGRQQLVDDFGTFSPCANITCGVPQG